MKKLWPIIFTAFLVVSCSSNTKNEISMEKKQVPEVYDREELHERMREMINSSEKLSEKQKGDFLTLHEDVLEKVDTITSDMRKLKLVLFKNLTEEKYDKKKVNELRRQLKKLNNEKFETMINAMSNARDILGVSFKDVYPRDDFGHGGHDYF